LADRPQSPSWWISGALLFFSGIVGSDDGSPQLLTIGRVLVNPR